MLYRSPRLLRQLADFPGAGGPGYSWQVWQAVCPCSPLAARLSATYPRAHRRWRRGSHGGDRAEAVDVSGHGEGSRRLGRLGDGKRHHDSPVCAAPARRARCRGDDGHDLWAQGIRPRRWACTVDVPQADHVPVPRRTRCLPERPEPAGVLSPGHHGCLNRPAYAPQRAPAGLRPRGRVRGPSQAHGAPLCGALPEAHEQGVEPTLAGCHGRAVAHARGEAAATACPRPSDGVAHGWRLPAGHGPWCEGRQGRA